MKIECPICKAESPEIYRDMLDGHILMEYMVECPTQHWGKEFVTGYTCEWVYGRRVFITSYHRRPAWDEVFRHWLWIQYGRARWRIEQQCLKWIVKRL